MARAVKVTLHGMKDLERRLRLIGDRAPAVGRHAVSLAATPIVSAAKRYAERSKDTGALQASIGKVVKVYKHSGVALAVVGPRRGAQFKGRANIAHLIEYGWRKVKAKTGTLKRTSGRQAGTAARSKVTGKRGEGVEAGRVEGRPFIRPAWDAKKDIARQRLYDVTLRGIEREAAKLGAT